MSSSLSRMAPPTMAYTIAIWLTIATSGLSASEREIEAADSGNSFGYRITQSQEVRAPRGPIGDWPDSGCFTWQFQIDKDGSPYNLTAEKHSRNYGLHVAMRSSLTNYRFKAEQPSDPNTLYTIGFDYVSGNSTATLALGCSCTDQDSGIRNSPPCLPPPSVSPNGPNNSFKPTPLRGAA